MLNHFHQVSDPWACERPRGSVDGGLVADLEDHVIECIHFLHNPAHELFLAPQHIRMLECLDTVVVRAAFALDIVLPIERRHRPATLILRVEETDLDHDAARVGLCDEILEAPEILRIPAIQVKAVAARTVARRLAAGPGLDQVFGFGRERVIGMKCALRLDERRRVDARVVQPVGL